MNKPVLVWFDVDGTLTRRDTMWLFFRRVTPVSQGLCRLLLVLPLALWRGGPRRETLKKAVVKAFLGGLSASQLREAAEVFAHRDMPRILNTAVYAALCAHKAAGGRVLLVSAALDIWLEPFARREGLELVCTLAQYTNGVFQGDWQTPNCRGPEKVSRLREYLGEWSGFHTIAYGNSAGDREMLRSADEARWVDRLGHIVSPKGRR
jgi:phosphatidylglycerophosphatase C